jgi:hypothetical protein
MESKVIDDGALPAAEDSRWWERKWRPSKSSRRPPLERVHKDLVTMRSRCLDQASIGITVRLQNGFGERKEVPIKTLISCLVVLSL